VRTIPHGGAARLEVDSALAAVAPSSFATPFDDAAPSYAPEHADELMLLAGFLRRPGPELRVVGLDASEIAAA
jgi:hypothetical protein